MGQTDGLPAVLIEVCAARRTNRIMAMFNTTTLFRLARRQAVGRRRTMAAVVAGLWNGCAESPDPIGPLSTEWQRLHQQTVALCHKAQDLEAQLLRTVRAPIVAVEAFDGADCMLAHSHEDIDAILGDSGSSAGLAEDLHSKLSARQQRWSAEADREDFDEAQRHEADAWAQEADAAQTIFRTPATSLVGVQIKLALMIEMCMTGMIDPAFPLPQLQSTFADVENLISTSSRHA